jgi:hypothetical protein
MIFTEDVGVPMENRLPMMRRDVAPEHTDVNELCEPPQRDTPHTPLDREPADAESKTDLHLNSNDAARRASELTRNLTT